MPKPPHGSGETTKPKTSKKQKHKRKRRWARPVMTPADRRRRREESIKPYGQRPPELTPEELEARCAEVRRKWEEKPYLMRRRNQYAPLRVEVQSISDGIGGFESDRRRRGGVKED